MAFVPITQNGCPTKQYDGRCLLISRQAIDLVQGSTSSYSQARMILKYISFSAWTVSLYHRHYSLFVLVELLTYDTASNTKLSLSGEMDGPVTKQSEWPYASPAFQPDIMNWKHLQSLLDEWIYWEEWGIDYVEMTDGHASMMIYAPSTILTP